MSKSIPRSASLSRFVSLTAVAIVVLVVGIISLVPPSSALTSNGNITSLGTPLTENFDTLASAGTGITWTDNVTIPGWYSTRTTYNSGTGSSATGALYSFGVTGTNPVTDRALGSVASGGTGTVYQAARLTNNTGGTITSLNISYTGEQWRNGGNITAHALTFQYQVANAGIVSAANTPTGGWTTFAPLTFTGPIAAAAAATLDGNAPANRVAISSTLTVTATAGQEIWIRWQDPDDGGSDHGLAIDDFSVTASGFFPGETEPSVTTTSPLNNAINVPVNSNIDVTFSESVTATVSAFSIQCPNGSPQTFSQTASPSTTFTLNPTADLPYSTVCTVTVTANQISDTDLSDPPDNMASDYVFSFTTADPPIPVATNVIINEIDADTPGADTAEFIELFDGGVGNTSLTGLVVVLFNGSSDLSYNAYDLDGRTTDANGYFVIGGTLVPGVDFVVPDGFIQNGQDAVALYAANATDFPTGTPVSTVNVQDAIVYDNGQADDAGLLVLLNAGQPQVDEGGTTNSIGRCPNGSGGGRNTSTYYQGSPSPKAASNCPPPQPPSTSPILISQLYGGGGNSGATYQNDYVELYNRSAAPVDISGWSLQYTSEDGSSWDFGKQPLGGTIGPGEYLLIALGSGGIPGGAPLPAAQINGQINMSGTSGKVALVNNFDGLVGNCPLGDPSLMDFVGYGSPDCREGATPAPAPSNTTSIFRQGGGSIDTNNNGSDFITGSPTPRQTAPIVELGPLVLSTDPRTNGTNAPRDATIMVTFTEPVDVVDPWFDITCPGGQHNSATFATTGGGQTHFITPNVNFVAGEQCTVTIFKDQIHDQDTDDVGTNSDTLPANYVWSFTVSTGTAPPYPLSVHLTMGNPSGAIASTSQPLNYLMEKPEYSLSYNRDRGAPNWVSWHLTDEWIGTLTRVDTFRPDPAVPPDWYRVQSFDFAGSGFDRGHMVPNADRDKETSIPINQATFLMSNMVAQAPDNNQGPWASFEGYLRTLLPGDEIYIVAGGVGTGGSGSNGGLTMTIANGNVTVPAQTWKVALVIPKDSGDDISRVTCGSRTIAILMPNTQGIRTDPWENFLTTVDAVETLTGYDFYSNLPDPVERCVEAGTNGVNPPLDTDNDGLPDSTDPDDDNDTFSDTDEVAAGSDPLNANSTPEVCDGVDNDLNEGIDEGFTNTDGDSQADCVDTDDDNDGFSDTDETAAGSDPLNANSTPEVCDGVDNDLNDGIDEGFTNTDGDSQADCVDTDDDNDTFSDTAEVAAGSDPLNAASTPEVCDGVDNDLNDGVDEGFTNTDGDGQADCVDTDDDNDTFSDTAEVAAGSDPLNAASTPEVCDGVDNDLNDGVDEGFPNTDGDSQADCVDADDDNDGQSDVNEIACGSNPLNAGSKSLDTDGDNVPNCVDADDDNDGVADGLDNCQLTPNPSQANNDGDAAGDPCDADDDNDGVLDGVDNCPFTANPGQANNDGDGLGDVCDPDDDNDGVLDGVDNCPLVANSGQADFDGDGIGDACDSSPHDNVQIVFSSNRDGNFEIYGMKADGTGVTRLTNNGASDLNPALSADRTKIVFTSTREGNFEIYSMNTNGTGVTRLTNNSAIDGFAAWSPTGAKIAFTSTRNGNLEIYSMNSDGTGVTRLTNNSAIDANPAWSPNGLKIAFTSTRHGNVEIYSMNPDGTGVTRLTNHGDEDAFPTWSPDSAKIAFASNRPGGLNFEIYSMNANGTGVTRLTNHSAIDVEPAWGPTGKIAFTSTRNFNVEIYSMNSNGTGVTRLTNNPFWVLDASPHW